ncbi:MAG TPA: hypothetical protein VF041_14435 [Gemmatimonadaceae bacterium]
MPSLQRHRCFHHRLPIVALALLAATSPLAAQRATEATDAHLREECRLATQALTTGRPHPRYSWALDQIRVCDQSAGPALASRWRALREADRTELGHLSFTSRSVRDQRIFDAALAVAGARGTAPLIRLAALGVLASHVDPTVYVSLEKLEHPKANQLLPAVLDFAPRDGAVPLAESDKATFLTFLRGLVEHEPDPQVATAARYLLRGFMAGEPSGSAH